MTNKQIKTAIMGVDSLVQLNELSSLIADCKTMLGRNTLTEGSKVWCVQKTKKTPGVITKMNIKKAIVDMNGMKYNVPFSMLVERV
jgi:hypothetical protein